jgi:predicted hydrocarbon binding protein
MVRHTILAGETMSDTYCYCTTGWFEEIFEMVVGHPVSVAMDESIKRGDKRCKVTVTL